jgi:formate/nitrite transporter FocA (FNT family)
MADPRLCAARVLGRTATRPRRVRRFTIINTLQTQVAVILGNLIGGACLVALVYWLAYVRPRGRE